MWVFGYGSLVWKVDFPYKRKKFGYIKGFKRRFYQESTDHRGVPEKPGRVVTLIPGYEQDRVYGVAYEIAEDNKEDVIKNLDYREKGGYERVPVVFFPNENEPFEMSIYIGNKDNPHYAGPLNVDSLSRQIFNAVGPSGPNIEYVLNLSKVMKEFNVDDFHLYSIETKLKKLLENDRSK